MKLTKEELLTIHGMMASASVSVASAEKAAALFKKIEAMIQIAEAEEKSPKKE